MQKIELKGLSPEQVDRLLPEGLISLCWRGASRTACTCQSPLKRKPNAYFNSRRKPTSVPHFRRNRIAIEPSGCASK